MRRSHVQLRQFALRPLNLHERLPPNESPQHRALSALRVSGAFSAQEMHSWLAQQLLAELPDRLHPEAIAQPDAPAQLFFENVLLGTQLHCIYKKSQAEFLSENVHTLSVVRDVLSRETARRKLAVSFSFGAHVL